MNKEIICKFKECGGCTYQGINYLKQLKIKKEEVVKLYPQKKVFIEGMDIPYNYRNKAIMTFKNNGKRIIGGLYSEGSHKVVEISDCLITEKRLNEVLNVIIKLVNDFKLTVYNPKTRYGLLRHVLLRYAKNTDEVLVCFIVGNSEFKGSKNFISKLINLCPNVKTVTSFLNVRNTSVVVEGKEKVLYGKGYIVDELLGNTYRISASSFYQINHTQIEKLYTKAIDIARLNKKDIVIDAYCGIGTIGMSLANKVNKVIGVELNKNAISDARNNAKMNRISNISFINDDATKWLYDVNEEVDIIILDPPREGSTKEFIDSIGRLNPKKVLYISCNPYSQKRDIDWLSKYNYDFKEVYAYDLFPFSKHIETVILLSKKY